MREASGDHPLNTKRVFLARLAAVAFVVSGAMLVVGNRGAVASTAADPLAVTASPAPSPAASPAAEQGDPCGGPTRLLATLNRPTVGYSVCAVPKGSIVLEEGYQLQSEFDGGSVSAAYPQGFERFGVADRLEIDVVGPTYNRVRSGSSLMTGYSDVGVGLKYEFEPKGSVTYAFDALFTPPDGDRAFTVGGTTEQLNADVSYAITPQFAIATTLAGIATYGSVTTGPGAGDGPPSLYALFFPSVVVTYATHPSLQFYLEGVGATKTAPGAGGRFFFDGGVQKLLGRNLEIDAEYGRTIGALDGDRFQYFGAGFGLRVPQ